MLLLENSHIWSICVEEVDVLLLRNEASRRLRAQIDPVVCRSRAELDAWLMIILQLAMCCESVGQARREKGKVRPVQSRLPKHKFFLMSVILFCPIVSLQIFRQPLPIRSPILQASCPLMSPFTKLAVQATRTILSHTARRPEVQACQNVPHCQSGEATAALSIHSRKTSS